MLPLKIYTGKPALSGVFVLAWTIEVVIIKNKIMKIREFIKIDNNDGTYHYELSEPFEVNIEKKYIDKVIKKYLMELLSKLIDLDESKTKK